MIVRRTRLHVGCGLLGLALALGPTSSASAEPPPLAPPTVGGPPKSPSLVTAEFTPALSDSGVFFQGYNEFVVRVRNASQKPVRGEVTVESPQSWDDQPAFETRAPYAVAAESSAFVQLPVRVRSYEARLTVRDEAGEVIATQALTPNGRNRVFMVDLTTPSLLRGVLDEVRVTPDYNPMSYGGSPVDVLMVGSPRVDPATGDIVLPEHTASYGTADVVVTPSDTLARLSGRRLEALAGFVMGGGTLAISIRRPEDLRHETLVAFVGGPVEETAVDEDSLEPIDVSPFSTPGAPRPPAPAYPGDELAKSLHGYRGGNLAPSPFGAAAPYGLGEVHVLAFDPTRRPGVDDPWVHDRMVDLGRRSYERRASVVFRPGGLVQEGMWTPSTLLSDVRKQLDPNVSARWSIAVAALLLLVYSVVAGPISFSRNAKQGHPLRALRHLPLWSLGTFLLIVVIGIAAKGVKGRSRHLTLVEAGAGMTHGIARRYRGFYTPRSKDLIVFASDTGSIVSSDQRSEGSDTPDRLRVDRDGTRLVDLTALPWQTIVVREDGFADLEDGIAIVRGGEPGETTIHNRTGRALRAAIFQTADGDFVYWPSIAAGASADVDSGRSLGGRPAERDWLAEVKSGMVMGARTVHGMGGMYLQDILEDDAAGLAEAWTALEHASGQTADWFPEGVPVLVAQLDGGEGHPSDSGMALDRDRLLVRVVGYGGAP
jgi:hypothetical protein